MPELVTIERGQVCNGKHPVGLHCLKVKSQKNPKENSANGNDTTGQQKSSEYSSVNSFTEWSHLISISEVSVRIGHEGTNKMHT